MPIASGYKCFKATCYNHLQNQSDWGKNMVRLHRHVARKAVTVKTGGEQEQKLVCCIQNKHEFEVLTAVNMNNSSGI
jgi:hypothetical protein